MATLLLDIALPADRFIAVYEGRANRVMLRSRDGRSVSLPAHHLRPFLDHRGVYGSFELEFDDAGRLVALRRIS